MAGLPITLSMFVKNEEDTLAEAIECVRPLVSEIVIVDTGSTDSTVQIARTYTDKVYRVGFTDFGNIRTLAAHLATQEWVFMLDADERILPEDWSKLKELIDQPYALPENNYEVSMEGEIVIDSWALPRKRWSSKEMSEQVDVGSWPDWQVRLFKNHPDKRIGFRRRVHETICGCVRTEQSIEGPVIHHFQGLGDSFEDKKLRASMYKDLYNRDLKDGVVHDGPPVIDKDDV